MQSETWLYILVLTIQVCAKMEKEVVILSETVGQFNKEKNSKSRDFSRFISRLFAWCNKGVQ